MGVGRLAADEGGSFRAAFGICRITGAPLPSSQMMSGSSSIGGGHCKRVVRFGGATRGHAPIMRSSGNSRQTQQATTSSSTRTHESRSPVLLILSEQRRPDNGTATARRSSADATTGCPVERACLVAWRFGELSQQSVVPHS